MNWYKAISWFLDAAMAIVLFHFIYEKLGGIESKLSVWGYAVGTFLAIYYSCKVAMYDTRSDTK